MSYAIDKMGGENPLVVDAVRTWLLTGDMPEPDDGDAPNTANAAAQPRTREATEHVGRGVYVSKEQLANAEEMGIVMQRQPRRVRTPPPPEGAETVA